MLLMLLLLCVRYYDACDVGVVDVVVFAGDVVVVVFAGDVVVVI